MCGIIGIYADEDASNFALEALLALQHRGQESAGMVASGPDKMRWHAKPGLTGLVFDDDYIIDAFRGNKVIAQNRYSTSKKSGGAHLQPIMKNEEFAFAHNGNLPSVVKLKRFLKKKVKDIGGYADSELMAEALYGHILKEKTPEEAIRKSFPLFTGAFSCLAMTKNALFAFRDPVGIRPLSMAKLNGGYVFASETCAFSSIGAEFIREVLPGELITVTQDGMTASQLYPSTPQVDIFEFVYFARPDSNIYGVNVGEARSNCGTTLAVEHPLDVDIIVPVPQTSEYAALAYSQKSGIPMAIAVVKSHYTGRNFITPSQKLRELGIKRKFSVNRHMVEGKRVALVDDSIVRGTTSKQLVRLLRDYGAKEVHFLVSSPPVIYPDFYGIDIKKQSELVAFGRTSKEISEWIGADSVNYLSLEGLIRSIGIPEEKLCTSIFTGDYPIPLHEREKEVQFLRAAA